MPNSELVEAIDSSDEWIQERSGIKSRRWAGPDDTVVSMSEAAARDAVAAAGIEISQIEAIIVSTVTHPYQTPAAAPIIADRLGLRCPAFDISVRKIGSTPIERTYSTTTPFATCIMVSASLSSGQ